MEKRIAELIGQINTELKKKFREKLDKIILFGSYARGEHDNESDIDILVLVDDEEPKRYNNELVDFEVDLTIKYGVLPSIIIRNTHYFNENKGVIPFYRNVEQEGVEIYAA
ncbi:MAG: nucleotidyltransferase domain-containing protein [Candidatus Aminicenantes bacterium]|nr:nucleotidyltransferase domain-containing protein [Candidatus Aminicenantes bacterium]